jgi:putative transposase
LLLPFKTRFRFVGSICARRCLFKEVKRRTRVIGVFPNETSASMLVTEIALRSSEEWTLRRYLTMNALEAAKPAPRYSRH